MEWINVKDKLPKTNVFHDDFIDPYYTSGPVLAYCEEPGENWDGEATHIFIAEYTRYKEDCEELRGWTEFINGEDINPVAWMPLPEAYGKDGEME